jgi:predicted transglutaminase-like cysteine proteinase
MPAGQETASAPPGFISFCNRFPEQCDASPSDPQTIHLTLAVQHLLESVSGSVNRAIAQEDDIRHYGIPEYWDIPTDGFGNSKHFALMKRKQLIAQGLPERALRLAILVAPHEGRHVVLTVATDKGDFVLDNRTSEVRPWTDISGTWIERQDADGGLGWVTLSPEDVPAAAVR